jgi:hypothetical protein
MESTTFSQVKESPEARMTKKAGMQTLVTKRPMCTAKLATVLANSGFNVYTLQSAPDVAIEQKII